MFNCCSVLRCVAVYCGALQCGLVCCSVLHYVAACGSEQLFKHHTKDEHQIH